MKQKKYIVYTRGETLTELIVYISLLVIIMIVVINSLVGIMQSYRIIKTNTDIENSAMIATDRIEREVRNASSIVTASSTFDVNPGTLVLDSIDASGTVTTLKFYVESGTLSLDVNGAYQGPLTISGVTVSNLVFREATTTNSTGVKMEMTLTAGSGTTYRSDNFYDTGTLRESY